MATAKEADNYEIMVHIDLPCNISKEMYERITERTPNKKYETFLTKEETDYILKNGLYENAKVYVAEEELIGYDPMEDAYDEELFR